jgi:dihydroneopterin aldolase
MTDTVFIDGLHLLASIGVHAHEKQAAQTLFVYAELEGDFSAACDSDQIDDALDYAAVAKRLEQVAADRHHELLEHLGARMAAALLSDFPIVDQLCLRLSKPNVVPGASAVGVVIRRQRSAE